jgi:hypothetical protein
MNATTLVMICLAGLIAGGGLLLRRQLNTAPLVPNPLTAKPRLKRPSRQAASRRIRLSHPQVTRRRTNRQWLQRLNLEERRQRPGEGRN